MSALQAQTVPQIVNRKLKILLVSERFHPRVGGVETVTRLLATGLVRLGHRVRVMTRERAGDGASFGYAVLRYPGPIRLLWQYASADAVIVQGPAVRLGWPLFWRRGLALMIHHMKPGAAPDRFSGWLRSKLARRAHHAAVSKALAEHLPWPVEAILPNPYDAGIFQIDPAVPRALDVIFVGRLIPEKGATVLVRALAILRQSGQSITAMLVGEGPERGPLGRELGSGALEKNVQFAGEVTGSRLAQMLNQHRLMIVPSLGEEGFGVVALEGIACGCAVIGSDAGGLPEAIGPCGTTFPMGNAESLAAKIRQLLGSDTEIVAFHVAAGEHLAKHRPSAVARRYLDLLASLPANREGTSRQTSRPRILTSELNVGTSRPRPVS